MSEDVHQTIIEEIGKLPGDKKYNGDTVMVCCPFHHDKTPSCGIYTSVGMEIPLGFYHCFGCGVRGNWNQLAEHAGLAVIKGWKLKDAGTNSLSALRQTYEKIGNRVGTYASVALLMKALGRSSYMQWPEDVEWRGYPGRLVQDAGGLLNAQRTGSNVCFFPCKHGSKYIGGVAAYLSKQMNGSSYINSQGDWAKDKGLFPIELTRKMIRKYKLRYVVLVEGPRDALALLSYGIPALAVLGAEQFGSTKVRSIEMLDIGTVYTMTDNDGGGKLLRGKIDEAFRASGLKSKHFKLPREKDDKGKLIKLDPDNCPIEIIREVKSVLRDKYGKGCLIPAKRLGWNRKPAEKAVSKKKRRAA
ncbi:putative DNA primase [Erwinia phage vB_EamM_Yoloswag]|uniref:Putative DNA primase n=1 Tax=Erwinia phage vB_EamM_Yoloswag TaxID=1958956 RepID=A0A1S6L3G7_9CAUD|nr:putative DNA primase [Erwinia phage vB_EamM_Yoloswag]AQT28699.1 putative DNA primase [Erwinia phage vB_EamM_Yoloswag]